MSIFLFQRASSVISISRQQILNKTQFYSTLLKTYKTPLPIKKQTIPSFRNGILQVCQLKQNSKLPTTAAKANTGLGLIWKNIFGKYLLMTNILGSGILMVVGDVVAQHIEMSKDVDKPKTYDWERIGRMFIVGALQGPLHHYAYKWMDKLMPVANVKNTLRKILLDQILVSPAFLFIFFYSACYLEGKSLRETNNEVKEKFLFIYCMDWLLWPGAQYFNFRYLDTKYRVTFVNVCTALYNVFISYMKHNYNLKVDH